MTKKSTFPDPLATWEQKKQDSYGLKFAKSIGAEWFANGIITAGCRYDANRSKIRENRLFVRAEHDTEQDKTLFSREDGDLSMANLDWEHLNHAGKFCRVVSNGIGDENYKIDIRANDRITLSIQKKEREKHIKNMDAMPLLQMAKSRLNLDIIPKGFIPRDEEDLNIYEQLKEKPKIEIAEEIIIDYVKSINNYKSIEKNKNVDLTNNGLSAARIYTCSKEGVKVKPVDIEYLVHGRVIQDDFSDCNYFGYVDTVTIGDISREGNLSDTQLREVAGVYSKKHSYDYNYTDCEIDRLFGYQIDVLRFSFKTTKKEVFKKHKRKEKTVKLSKRKEDFNPPKRSDYEKIESVDDTWMEGSYVIGTEIVYDYKESEFITRDELNKAQSPFVVRATDIYQGRIKSFLDDIKPLAKELQRIHLKMQHLRSEIKPDIIILDEDILAEVDEKGNKVGFHKEVLNILNIKGVIIQKRTNMGDDGIKDGSAARPMASQQGSGLAVLLNQYAFYYNQIRDITGINPAADGSLPHDALLGVSQMAKLATNTATAHIVDAAMDFNKKVAELISSRVHAIFRNKNAKHLRKMYERAVGKRNIDALEVLKDRHLHDFGFSIEMIPTQEQMQEFKEDLTLYLQQGLISPEIKAEATRISKTSLKLASQYLAYMSKKRQEDLQKQQEKTMQMKTQSDVAAAKQASEGRIQEEAIKTKMKLQFESAMSNIRLAEKQALMEIESPLKEKEFEQEVYLEKVKTFANLDLAQFKEDAKDNRLKKQSSHQSKLIDQRLKDASPIDFENEYQL